MHDLLRIEGREMLSLLQRYIAINTAYPDPDYRSCIALFKKQANDDGFMVQEIVLPSGNSVFIITLEGRSKDLPSLALNHHMDVVPVSDAALWESPPFQAHVKDGLIYGRGTQDCKGLGVVHYEALRAFKRMVGIPDRTVHCIMVPDEERGGFCGTKEFIEHSLFPSLNIGYLLDEGMPSGNDDELLVKVDERTPIQIEVTSVGDAAHASGLIRDNCAHRMIAFLHTITVLHGEQQTRSLTIDAGRCISMHITSLATDSAVLNMIPSNTKATIDVRIPSTLTIDEGIIMLNELVAKHEGISYRVLATSYDRMVPTSNRSSFYGIVKDSVIAHGLRVREFVFEATTDARFYSHRGIQTLGLTPFTSTPNLHGTNECITLLDLEQGKTIFETLLHALCMNGNGKDMI